MLKYLLWICLLFTSFFSVAQFTDSIRHRISLSATGNLNKTNTGSSYLLNNEATFNIKNKKSSFNSLAGWVYGQQAGKLANNDFVTTIDFNLFSRSHKWYYWGLANYATSYSLRINNQLQSGLGAAYNFIDTTNAWLNLSDGIIYETSSLVTVNMNNEIYRTFRNSLRLSYRFVIYRQIILSGTNFLQNSLNSSNDYIIRLKNNLGFKLNNWLVFSTSIAYNKLSRTGRENLLLEYGLAIEKLF